ncbi:hypothetical protein ACPPVQ_02705 [Diaminobutyricibacter sp. McL0618]|uniref:hypothetical protein n=1 Tax=Leifsonia sp. McL0618 TaxID=3415677 RepID=UPI003CF3608B
MAFVTLTIATDSIACRICHLIIDDYDLLVEAGIADTFEVDGDPDDIDNDSEYNNE